MRTRTTALALLLLGAPLALPASSAAQGTVSRNIIINNGPESGGERLFWLDTHRGIEVRARGEVGLTDDGREVESLEEGGYLTLREGDRRIEYRRPGSGGIERRYFRDGREAALDADARAWAARFLDEVSRTTSVGARARFRRILAREGAAGVLAEVPRIESGSIRKMYLTELVASGRLRPQDTRRVLELTRGLSSSSGQRDVLLALLDRRMISGDLWSDWLRATASVSSNNTRSALLTRAVDELRSGPLPAAYFEAVRSISSSADRRAVLVKTAEAVPGLEPSVPHYLDAVVEIGSSSEQRAALLALLTRQRLSPASLGQWLRTVAKVGSDSEKEALLMAAVDRLPRDRATAAAFNEAAESIGSDTRYNRVVTAYLRRQATR
jgi:hypothetical protein